MADTTLIVFPSLLIQKCFLNLYYMSVMILCVCACYDFSCSHISAASNGTSHPCPSLHSHYSAQSLSYRRCSLSRARATSLALTPNLSKPHSGNFAEFWISIMEHPHRMIFLSEDTLQKGTGAFFINLGSNWTLIMAWKYPCCPRLRPNIDCTTLFKSLFPPSRKQIPQCIQGIEHVLHSQGKVGVPPTPSGLGWPILCVCSSLFRWGMSLWLSGLSSLLFQTFDLLLCLRYVTKKMFALLSLLLCLQF